MIIDTHIHVYPPEVVRDREKIALAEPHFAASFRGDAKRLCTAEDALAELTKLTKMSGEGGAEGWLCGFGFKDPGLCRALNEYACEAARRSNGMLRWRCVVPPMARGAVAEIERCAELGAIGVGEIFPAAQGWGMSECRETWRIAGVCHERNMHLLLHVEEYDALPGTYAFARNHPELVIVTARLGGGLFLCEGMPGVRGDLRNVFYDTSSVPAVYDSTIFEAGFSVAPNKIVFGSNFPDHGVRHYRKMLRETRLSDEDVERLFNKNAHSLLSLALNDV